MICKCYRRINAKVERTKFKASNSFDLKLSAIFIKLFGIN